MLTLVFDFVDVLEQWTTVSLYVSTGAPWVSQNQKGLVQG